MESKYRVKVGDLVINGHNGNWGGYCTAVKSGALYRVHEIGNDGIILVVDPFLADGTSFVMGHYFWPHEYTIWNGH